MLITKIGASCLKSHFPETFSNQLYYSSNVSLGAFTYRSSYSIKYVMSGFENYEVEGREMNLKEGEHLLVNNNSQVITLPAEGEALSIFIDPLTLRDIHHIEGRKSIVDHLDNPSAAGSTEPLFRECVYRQENTFLKVMLKALTAVLSSRSNTGEIDIDPEFFYNLSWALLKDQLSHSQRLALLDCKKSSTLQEQYERLILGWSYLNDQWNQPFSLTDTASVACLSPYHFHRLFHRVYGITPFHYHRKLQMQKAAEMLIKGQWSISEIAFSLGFGSLTAFGRAFKKYHKQPPSAFRSGYS